ncbi:NmrA family NAD(P)-binding protein [Nonomuraea sp. NEAU-A123]|uniref:NmrA family NAD(P)-binding protein n=1 Tax=Nonomuraea sp. NEAU-A123 TaxID=2839649 RepID=UPI001BE48022|nr:NmrA family NAD(P)-binding protein [Nonomuraea sp. NEAU-A123]MBT2235760.1 NmrA family NAD(P)-binding protein [Nonomuraea sp. NEAU-A123]
MMILVTGATGNIGSPLVAALAQAGQRVRALVRDPRAVTLPPGSERAAREPGVPWTFLRPRAFMSNALRWLPQLRTGDLVRVPFAGVAAAAIDPADIAAVAALALTSDGHEGRIYELTGPDSLLPADQIAVLAKVLRRDLRCEGLPDEEARAQMEASMPVEYVDAFFSFYVDGTLDESQVLPTVQEVTGHPPRTFEQWAETHADAFH